MGLAPYPAFLPLYVSSLDTPLKLGVVEVFWRKSFHSSERGTGMLHLSVPPGIPTTRRTLYVNALDTFDKMELVKDS